MNEDEYEGFKVGDTVKIKIECTAEDNCGDPGCAAIDGSVGTVIGVSHINDYPMIVKIEGSEFSANAKPSELTKVNDA